MLTPRQHQHIYTDPARRCETCQHFGHWTDGGHVWCLHGKIVFATPHTGCGYWVREPGSDDEDDALPASNAALSAASICHTARS